MKVIFSIPFSCCRMFPWRLILAFLWVSCVQHILHAQEATVNNRIGEILHELHKANSKYVMVAVHRGDWRNAPENSIRAIQLAIEMGADIVEIDVQRTKDGHLVVMHDKSLDRTTTGTGLVSNYLLTEIQEFYLKSGIGIKTRHKVPTLREVMLLAKDRVIINIDKGYDFTLKIHQVLKETGTLNQAILKGTVSYKELCDDYSEILHDVLYMPVVNLENPFAREMIEEFQSKLRPFAIEFVFSRDTSVLLDKLQEIRDCESRVWINTLWPSLNGGHHDDLAVEENDIDNSWKWLIDKGANILQTDRPKELIEYLKNNGLH